MKVLMIGTSGLHAGLVMPELQKRGAIVRALVRDQAKSDLALKRGASETVIGDLEDPVSLRKATEGIDAVFHIGPGMAPNEAAMGLALVGAAKAAGARELVFSGVIHSSLSQLTIMRLSYRSKRPCISRA